MDLFKRKNKPGLESIPSVLTQQEDPVNYNTVLDYLVGLSKPEYDKIFKVSGIYRAADKEAAKVLGVKDEPTRTLATPKPTDEEIDDALDHALAGDFIDDAPEAPKPVKQQASSKKIEIKDKA